MIPPLVKSAGARRNTPLLIVAPSWLEFVSMLPTVNCAGPLDVVPSAIKYCEDVPPAFTKLVAVVDPLIVVFPLRVVVPFFNITIASLLLFSSAPLPITNNLS